MNRIPTTIIALALAASAFGHEANEPLPELNPTQLAQVEGVTAALFHASTWWHESPRRICIMLGDYDEWHIEVEDAVRHSLAHMDVREARRHRYSVTKLAINMTYQVYGCGPGSAQP